MGIGTVSAREGGNGFNGMHRGEQVERLSEPEEAEWEWSAQGKERKDRMHRSDQKERLGEKAEIGNVQVTMMPPPP
jgi:hypothetical protein